MINMANEIFLRDYGKNISTDRFFTKQNEFCIYLIMEDKPYIEIRRRVLIKDPRYTIYEEIVRKIFSIVDFRDFMKNIKINNR